jgi:hypothetical protein
MAPNRLVTLLTPLIFAPLAGFISLKLADLGINLDSARAQDIIVQGAIFLGGVLVAYLKSRQWLKGWQDWERRTDDATNGALTAEFQSFLEQLGEKAGVPLPGAGDEEPTDILGGVDPPAAEPGVMGDHT